MRLDTALPSRGLAETRTKARSMIESGEVRVNGKIELKPAFSVGPEDSIVLAGEEHYVGRGGLKLERALDAFSIDVRGLVCLDAGASTGGFTDCLLRRGAAEVVAIERGHGQLHPSLAADPRVDSREETDIRSLPQDVLDKKYGFISADMSFISLRLTLPPMAELVADGTKLVCLIKPQFEVGPESVGKNGIVRDRKAHVRAIQNVAACARSLGLAVGGLIPSPVRGGSGNVEYLLLLRRGGEDAAVDPADTVRAAFL